MDEKHKLLKILSSESLKALGPNILTAIWVFYFMDPIKTSIGKLELVSTSILIISVAAFLLIDVLITIKRGISYYIFFSYAVVVLLYFFVLTFGDIDRTSSGQLSTQMLVAFLVVRFAAYVYVARNLHWGEDERPRNGLAVTSILINDGDARDRVFVLVKNSNLNDGVGLWISPGGRWDPGVASPEERLINKIAEEVNVKASVVDIGTLAGVTPPFSKLDSQDCRWFHAPHILLYERLGSNAQGFPLHHLDLVYVCSTKGEIAGKSPKYNAQHQITVPVRSCSESFDAAYSALGRAVDEWTMRTTGQRRARRDDIADDVVWRMHIAAKALIEKDMPDE